MILRIWILEIFSSKKFGAPCRIRTCGTRIRNPVLYPTELRGHIKTSNRNKSNEFKYFIHGFYGILYRDDALDIP